MREQVEILKHARHLLAQGADLPFLAAEQAVGVNGNVAHLNAAAVRRLQQTYTAQ